MHSSALITLILRNMGVVINLIVKLAIEIYMPNLALRRRYAIFKVMRYKATSSIRISEKDEKFLQSKGSTFEMLHNKIPILLSVIPDVICSSLVSLNVVFLLLLCECWFSATRSK